MNEKLNFKEESVNNNIVSNIETVGDYKKNKPTDKEIEEAGEEAVKMLKKSIEEAMEAKEK